MVQVTFGAKTQELEDGVSRAKSSIESMSSSTEEAQRGFDGLNEAMKSLNDTTLKGASSLSGFMKLIGVGAVGAAVGGLLDFLHKTEEGMANLDRNAKETGLTLAQFQQLKFAGDLVGLSTDKFVSGLQEASKKLNDLGHGTSDLSKFLDANNEKYELANGKLISTNQYLQMSARLIQSAATEGDKFKAAELLGFSRDWVAVLEQGPKALQATMDRAHELGIDLDDNAIHKAGEFEAKWRESSAQWEATLKKAALSVASFLEQQIAQAKTDWENFATDVSNLWNRMLGSPVAPMARQIADQVKEIANATLEASGASRVLAETMRQSEESSDGVKRNMQSASGAGGSSKSTIFPEKDDKDALRAALEEMRGAIQLEDIAFASAQQHAASSLKLFGTTEGQKTQFLLAELQKRQDLELAAVAKASEIDTDSEAAKQRVVNESMAIEAKFLAERQKIIDQAAVAEAATWESALKPIQGAWDSQLRGLLSGTTTWAQATKNIVADLVLDMIKSLEAWAVKKAAIALASALAPNPAQLATNTKAIGGDLGQTYAGFAAFFAPILGPGALAAAAALTATVGATALTMSVAGSAEGGAWEIPAPGLWNLHAGETVLPAAAASGFRNLAEGGGPFGNGGGGGDTHIHIHTIDAAGVQRFVNQYSGQLAGAVQAHIGRNPTTFSR